MHSDPEKSVLHHPYHSAEGNSPAQSSIQALVDPSRNPHHPPSEHGTVMPPSLTFDDIGEFPSSVIASLVASSTADFCALCLSCKAAFGAAPAAPSSVLHSNLIHTGLSRQTTYLSLSTRAFLKARPRKHRTSDVANATSLLKTTEFLARHSGTTTLIITQAADPKRTQRITLEAVPVSLPLLRTLHIYADDTDDKEGVVDQFRLLVDTSSLACLRSLVHLTFNHCSLRPSLGDLLVELPNLTFLDLNCCDGIGELVISSHLHLTRISMGHTDVSSLAVSGCPVLDSLQADSSASLTSFSIMSCPAITHIALQNCQALPSVDVRSCAALMVLDVSESITLGQVLAAGCLRLTGLHAMSCHQLNHIDVAGCCTLKTLLFESELATQLDISSCSALQRMTLDLPLLSELSGCPTLKQLGLANCSNIPFLDLSLYPKLERLKLKSCGMLQLVHASHMPHLADLSVLGCSSMTELLISHCPVLATVHVQSPCLAELSITDLPLLHTLRLTSAAEDTVNNAQDVADISVQITNCPALFDVFVKHAGLAALDLSETSTLQRLRASECLSLVELYLAGCASLEELRVSSCTSLRQLDLSGVVKLHTMDLGGCRELLHSSPQLLNCSSLTTLHLTLSGPMPSLAALHRLTNLHLVDCPDLTHSLIENLASCCQLETLTLSACTSLQYLDVAPLRNLCSLVLTDCISLVQLGSRVRGDFHSNDPHNASRIEHLSVNNSPSMQSLDLSLYLRLQEISLRRCDALTAVRVGWELFYLSINLCSSLSELNLCRAINLNTLKLKGLPALAHIDLTRCRSLQRLKVTESAVAQLGLLDCRDLESVELGSCCSLLRIAANGLTVLASVKVVGCGKLAELQLSGCGGLHTVMVGASCPVPMIDLTEASRLAMTFVPESAFALCPICMTGTVTHGFLHERSVHRVCGTCAGKVSRPVGEGVITAATSLICPICTAPGQLAKFLSSIV